MARRHTSIRHAAALPAAAAGKKLQLHRDTLKTLDARAVADDRSRQPLTAKCVTFSVGPFVVETRPESNRRPTR